MCLSADADAHHLLQVSRKRNEDRQGHPLLAFPCPEVRPCHGILVNISLAFSPCPTLATELQGPSSTGVPGDLSVSGAERAGGEGFPESLDHIPIYTPLPTPTLPLRLAHTTPCHIPRESPGRQSPSCLPTTRLGPGSSLGLDHLPAPPSLQGPLWATPGHLSVAQEFSKCPHQWHLLLRARAA